VLDLVGDPRQGGRLSNIATVIGELLQHDKLDVTRLVRRAAHDPRLFGEPGG
jgi:hypothetical protein